jgi:hypothetical protein
VFITFRMKKLLQLALLILICNASIAQKYLFVYLQTDNKQPFYVKMKDKVLSSSQSGYLVVPKLTAGELNMKIGFPKEKWPQQSFNIIISDNDAGYLLKNFDEKGWGLYNLQTMEIVMNGAPASSKNKTTTENDDAFAATLSTATNTDVVVKKVPIPTPKTETIIKTEPVKIEKAVVKNTIEKYKTINDKEGKSITYLVKVDNEIDTVNVFIPSETAPEKSTVRKVEKIAPAKVDADKKEKFLDIELQNPNVTTGEKSNEIAKRENVTAVETENKKTTDKPSVSFNSDCRAFASDDDFFKTRKKMVAEDNDEAMVEAARKLFKVKCYSVEQIKNLSLLFLNDNSKYNFFDAVYPHTSDTQNFVNLQSLLKDDYYIKRFKAMMRN